jgi:dihydroorotate dehydrogenase
MNHPFTRIRNKTVGILYRHVLKRVFFAIDPEKTHDMMSAVGIFLGTYSPFRYATKCLFHAPSSAMLEQTIAGIQFSNPVGLAAGFDKNAELTDILPAVGFGFEEIGSITGEPCEGNPKPRLWRLKKSKGLVVYYGLKNDGAEAIATRLKHASFQFPIGVSVAKTNSSSTVDTAAGIADYLKAYTAFAHIGDYDTINISCPNAFGGEPFTDPKKLEQLLQAIQKKRNEKPLFLKLSPDLSQKEIDALVDVALRYDVDGFICSNLTKKAKEQNPHIQEKHLPTCGGISGVPVKNLSTNLITHIYKKTQGKKIIIGCGGIMSAKDAYEKIKAGASLVQLITGMIFEGPQLISDITIGLETLLKKDGYTHITQAIGSEAMLSTSETQTHPHIAHNF